MSNRRSKRMAAWDFAWTHIGPVAGIGADPTPAQDQLREGLAQLYDMPMPARAIEQMAMAIYTAWKIGIDQGKS